MIPKIIHYCWFGNKEKPENVKKYIQSWKETLSDYQIIEWNEDNFPIDYCRYSKEAYENGKYAFVSDVARLYALKKYGGIYFDTDIEVLRNFDSYLADSRMVVSYESNKLLMTGFFAAEANCEVISDLLKEYNNREFVKSDGSLNMTANTVYMTNCLMNFDVKRDVVGSKTTSGIRVYDFTTFGAFDADNSTFEISEKTVLVHHCLASWSSKEFQVMFKIKRFAASIAGGVAYKFLRKVLKK